MSISLIRAQNPQGVVDAGLAEKRKAAELDAIIGDQVRSLNIMRESWFGRGANAAIAKAYRDIQKQNLAHNKLAALAAAASISLWNPYGTQLVQIQNSDTQGLGTY